MAGSQLSTVKQSATSGKVMHWEYLQLHKTYPANEVILLDRRQRTEVGSLSLPHWTLRHPQRLSHQTILRLPALRPIKLRSAATACKSAEKVCVSWLALPIAPIAPKNPTYPSNLTCLTITNFTFATTQATTNKSRTTPKLHEQNAVLRRPRQLPQQLP